MRYTVVWVPSAENDLASIWIVAPDRQGVADAADEIDRILRVRPYDAPEEQGGTRRLVVEPLEVVYTVSEDDRLVRVLQVTVVA
jgi:hypothetical protein